MHTTPSSHAGIGLLIVGGLVLLASGCGLVGLVGETPAYEIERREQAAHMADYVSAHLARQVRDREAEMTYYTRLARQARQDSNLLQRAVQANVAIGDVGTARELAASASAETRRRAVAAVLVGAVDLIAAGRWSEAATELAAPHGQGDTVAVRLLAAWADVFAGAETAGSSGDNRFGILPGLAALSNTALVSLVEGREDDARDALDQAWRAGMRHAPLVVEYLRLLRADGRDSQADELVGSFRTTLVDAPCADGMAGELSCAVEPLVAPGDRRAAVAQALSLLALEHLRRRSTERAIFHAHLALFLDRSLDATRIILADALGGAGQSARALEIMEDMSDPQQWRAATQSRKVLLLYDLERSEEAVAVAGSAVFSGLDRTGQFRLARFFAVMEMYDQAEAVLDDIIDADAAVGMRDWQMIFSRARARERQDGRWADAEADLRFALSLYPDHPEILNYLGYSLIDRNVKIDEGLSLIKRALVKSPRSGHIVDSLGWAYFRLQRFGQAVIHLEDAAALVPTDPVINSHLGDAYWKTGRYREARIQWQRAQGYDPDAGLSAELGVKLQSGLE